MKFTTILILLLLLRIPAVAQPDLAEQLRTRYAIKTGFEAVVIIRIDVPGITASPKTVEISYSKGKSPKIKGAGLILLPKKGLVGQFNELLTTPVQWIPLGTSGDIQSFKLVSLDPDCDWITADIKVNTKEIRIDEINLTTRDAGAFLITHFYGNSKYPDRSEISFATDKFSLPLKFMGKSDFSKARDSGGKVTGKITLEFTRLNFY
jgi:hypothetical protein